MSETKPTIRERVITYLQEQDEPKTLNDICAVMKLKPEQVGGVLYQLKNTNGLKKHGQGSTATWSIDPSLEDVEPVNQPTPRSGTSMMDQARELILNDPDREYTTEDLAEALQVDRKQAINLAGRLKQAKFVTSRFKNGNTHYKLNPKRSGGAKGKPKPKEAPQEHQQLSVLPSVQLSMEAENAMQTFAHALMQLENLRAENERLKQALTQILSIGSNAILK